MYTGEHGIFLWILFPVLYLNMKREIHTNLGGLNHKIRTVFPDHCHNKYDIKLDERIYNCPKCGFIIILRLFFTEFIL